MTMRPKFDPSQVTNLLNRGSAEARGAVRPLVSVPAAEGVITAAPENVAVPRDEQAAQDFPQAAEDVVLHGKRAITIRLSDEVLSALYRHQAEVRCTPGARLKDTTIGGVIDTLLRAPLNLSPVQR